MNITGIAHIVQTVRDIDKTGEFCVSVFEITAKIFGEDKMALKFGAQKINLHMKLKHLMNFKSILKPDEALVKNILVLTTGSL